MKKLKDLKGFVIAQASKRDECYLVGEYVVFTKEEWEHGEGCRYPEWECGKLDEAVDFINNYDKEP